MLTQLRNSLELFRDYIWFFRFMVIIVVICLYRTLLYYVLRFNHCANPFCSKCISDGSVRGRVMNYLKKHSDDDDEKDSSSYESIIHHNLIQYERLCQRNDEKPTVYFHRGLSSSTVKSVDETILIEHYDELRQEMVKFLQSHPTIDWSRFDFYRNGQEIETNCKMFPKLFEILQLLPNAICIQNGSCFFGNCFLTHLSSQSKEFEQNSHGLTNCAIRLHFGLICDDEQPSYVLIGKLKRLPIKTKLPISYNVALKHSIMNPQEKQQLFLTVDLWHHDLSEELRQTLATVFHRNLF